MQYAHLNSTTGALEFAPRTITIEGIYYNPTPLSYLKKHKYLPVDNSNKAERREGFYSVFHYEKSNGVISRVWEYFPISNEEDNSIQLTQNSPNEEANEENS